MRKNNKNISKQKCKSFFIPDVLFQFEPFLKLPQLKTDLQISRCHVRFSHVLGNCSYNFPISFVSATAGTSRFTFHGHLTIPPNAVELNLLQIFRMNKRLHR